MSTAFGRIGGYEAELRGMEMSHVLAHELWERERSDLTTTERRVKETVFEWFSQLTRQDLEKVGGGAYSGTGRPGECGASSRAPPHFHGTDSHVCGAACRRLPSRTSSGWTTCCDWRSTWSSGARMRTVRVAFVERPRARSSATPRACRAPHELLSSRRL
jgi:hypothetical protein